jgi:hypothetical protein
MAAMEAVVVKKCVIYTVESNKKRLNLMTICSQAKHAKQSATLHFTVQLTLTKYNINIKFVGLEHKLNCDTWEHSVCI